MNKEELVCNLVSMIYGNKIVGFDKRDEFLKFLKDVVNLVNQLDRDITVDDFKTCLNERNITVYYENDKTNKENN